MRGLQRFRVGNDALPLRPGGGPDHCPHELQRRDGVVHDRPAWIGRDVVSTSGTVLDHIVYGSFGSIISQTNSGSGDRFMFTGREYDATTGLYFYRARYYDPTTGRFVSQDPKGFAAGDANLYRYVGNDPTATTDPSGLKLMPNWPDPPPFRVPDPGSPAPRAAKL